MCNVKLKISLVRFIGMENAKEKLESLTCEEYGECQRKVREFNM